MNIKIDVDLKGALAKMKGFEREGQKAMASAINKTLAMSKTAGERAIRETYNLKAKDFKYKDKTSKVVVNKAFPKKLAASLYVRGRRMGLYLFGANKNKRSGFVSVAIKRGQRFTLKHAFIAPWRRGQSELWVMETDKTRAKIMRKSPTSGKPYETYPRKTLFTISLPEFFSTRKVMGRMVEVANKNFSRIFQHEFLARVKGFAKSRKAA